MSKADEYRSRAIECLAYAEQAATVSARLEWMRMAQKWAHMIRPHHEAISGEQDALFPSAGIKE